MAKANEKFICRVKSVHLWNGVQKYALFLLTYHDKQPDICLDRYDQR